MHLKCNASYIQIENVQVLILKHPHVIGDICVMLSLTEMQMFSCFVPNLPSVFSGVSGTMIALYKGISSM